MKTASRQYFPTQFEAEQFLRAEGYAEPIDEKSFWNSRDGLIDADVRYNANGYFITYRA